MALPNPVIVVPGITASYLRDDYSLPPEFVWTVLTKEYERSSLHPDNLRYEAIEPARVRPDQLYEIAYKELIEELRHNLRERDDRPVPVFPFSYDWRQPLDVIELQLADFIDEVIERTKLLKHYNDNDYAETPKVNLVGHSMGGLVIAGYLRRAAAKSRVAKVATLATPFKGSLEAVIKIITGTASLGTSAPSSREREAARLTPALYHLLPSFANGVETPAGLPNTLFDPAVWQPSVLDTLTQYIRQRGLKPTGAKQQAIDLFSRLLKQAREHRERIDSLALNTCGLSDTDWLCVVGVDSTTRVRIKVVKAGGSPDFDLSSEDRRNEWSKADASLRRLTGDGTVPFEGAIPSFLKEENLVCVTPDDFGYWEIGDKTTTTLAGFHGILPNMNMVHRLIVHHFTGRPDKHGNIWGRRAPGVKTWKPAIADLEEKEEKKP